MAEPFAFAAFRSRQYVMEFDAKLKRAGVLAGVINTPHEVALGCGLSVKFPLADYPKARAIYESYRPHAFVGFYKAEFKGMRMECSALLNRR